MVKQRKKRVSITKQLKRELFMAGLVRASCGTLPVGAFKAAGEAFDLFPGIVSNSWRGGFVCSSQFYSQARRYKMV
jgi:hypothetical protein